MIDQVYNKMNEFGAQGVPFLFMINFELDEAYVYRADEIPDSVDFSFNALRAKEDASVDKVFAFEKQPIDLDTFSFAFKAVKKEIDYGNSFLLNLTFPSSIQCNYSLKEMYDAAQAKYKLHVKDRFVSFSPETFVKIADDQIHSFPMKGTIDASIPFAEEIILDDPKEVAEHYTIVDLIRNDLAQVSTRVQVEKFRYIDEIQTNSKKLLQVSSHIVGDLKSTWREQIGTIFSTLLPAGSISGAPKKKTREIIQEFEMDSRGFYTGVAGYFDGDSVDSCVLIRYIEQQGDKLIFRSGGGITFQSVLENEYQELIDKIYVPIF